MTTAIPASTAPTPDAKRLAIIGGGITGLSAAYEAVKRGETNIHVYEATNRFGGKIQSGTVAGETINRGAEFVDSDHTQLIALAKELGINLIENKRMEREEFQRPDGKLLSDVEFYTAYRPYAEQVMQDREAIMREPNGIQAKLLGAMTLAQYSEYLEQKVTPVTRGFWQALTDIVTFKGNSAKQVMRTAALAYESEVGQPMRNISAIQFLNETSGEPDQFLISDCNYRVEGGTEAIITALREKLQASGVSFHTGAQLNSAVKNVNGKTDLIFSNPELNTSTDKLLLTLPTYAYRDIAGLETLGLSADNKALLANTQYTNSFKLTVAFNPGAATPDSVYFAPTGFQCWSPAPGLLTFLSNADDLKSSSTKTVIMDRLNSYAKAHGSTAEKMFDLKQLDFNNPGAKACYASLAVGQAEVLGGL
ncbi:MAG: flavin monoamine oxidase family protein, partial [Rickettsiales bacterium]